MRDRFPAIYLLLILFVTAIAFADPSLAKNSGKKQAYPVTFLDSIHKVQPERHSETTRNKGFRQSVIALTSVPSVKRRPWRKRMRRTESAASLRRKLSSRSAIVMDEESGEIIYSHAPDRPAQPASTIKIITGLIALQNLDGSELVPASRHAASMPRSKIYIRRGKSYRADDLINAVLLSSANDASVALAEKIAGSERVFSRLMTRKAKAWGATQTVCKTATGLTARGQKSTARDLAVLFNRAMDNPEFANRVAKAKIRTGFGKLLRNHNRALWQIEGAEGGKTGFTNAARQTYVGQFRRGDDELTVAILGSETMWDDIKRLVEYGFAHIRSSSAARDTSPLDRSADALRSPVQLGDESPFQILYASKKVSPL